MTFREQPLQNSENNSYSLKEINLISENTNYLLLIDNRESF
jgi:hypothetical protein